MKAANRVHISSITAAGLTALALVSCGGPDEAETRYVLEAVVAGGSPFHGVHGMRFDDEDNLYAVSVIGQSVFRVDTETGAIETIVGPPEGMADDIAIANDGTLVWTAIEDGIVYARDPDGSIRRLMEDRRGVNAVSFSPDGERLFVTLVFYGDALYELDLSGANEPRLIREGMGGLNAFEVNDDGMIYGPLVFGAQVVRIDPDSGEMTTISDDFTSAGALKLESNASALVLDDGLTLKRVNLETGETSIVAEFPFGADNLDIDSKGRVFASLSEVNAIAEVDTATGEISYLIEPAPLTSATGLAVHRSDDGDRIYIGDLFGGVKIVDAETGQIEDTPIDIFQPAHVSVTGQNIVVVGEVFGLVQLLDRESFEVLGTWDGLDRPGDALEAPNGEIIVAETGAGRLVRISRTESGEPRIIARGLAGPAGLAWADADSVYLTETEAGRLLRVELATGSASAVTVGLARPEGVAVDTEGNAIVVEVAAQRLTRVDPATGITTVIADDLPIGLSDGPSLYRGVAASESVIYFNSDIDNAIYRLAPE